MRKIIPIIIDIIQSHTYTAKDLLELLFIYTYITHNEVYEFYKNNDIILCDEILSILKDLHNSKDIYVDFNYIICPYSHNYVKNITDDFITISIDIWNKVDLKNKTINQCKIDIYNAMNNF